MQPDADELVERHAPRRGLRVLVLVGVLLFLGGWVAAIVYSLRPSDEERLDEPSRRAVADACSDALDELADLPPLDGELTAEIVAGRVEDENAVLDDFVARARAVTPDDADARVALTGWLDDWDALVANRADFAAAVRAGEETVWAVPTEEERRRPITVRMRKFSEKDLGEPCSNLIIRAEPRVTAAAEPRPGAAIGAAGALRPLVAVVGRGLAAGRVLGWRDAAVGLGAPYLDAVARRGATPTLLPPMELDPADAARLLARFDGLVLTGGADVDPAEYGEDAHPSVYGVDARSDAFERTLVQAALAHDVPTLAICRGLQVLNVALGGTLVQHLPDVAGTAEHGRPGTGAQPVLHPVTLTAGSLAARSFGTTVVRACSSHHHQAVGRLAPGLVVTGCASDGVVEAVEVPDRWVLAVQWHPEDTAAHDPVQQRAFDSLVEAIAARAVRPVEDASATD